MEEYRHYIRTDDRGQIVYGFSNAFRQPEEGDICIDEHGSYQFRLYENGEENPCLHDEYGIPLYQYINGEVTKRTEEELEAERAKMEAIPKPPTAEERLVALENTVMKLLIQ